MMGEQGLWDLFWATGLPEAWLEARQEAEQARDLAAPPPAEETDG